MVKNRNRSAYRPHRKRVKHPALLALFLLILALGLLWGTKVLIDYITAPRQETENAQIEIIPTIRPSQESQTTNNTSTPDSEDAPDKTPIKTEGANPNYSSGLTGSITYAAVSGDKAIIRINIDQTVGENGTCALTLSKSGRKDITKAVNTMDNPASSTCQGFDIPVKELSKGIWNIKIDLSAGGKLGHLEGQIEI